MSQDITEFEKLLDEFNKVYDLNKPKYEPSYLEICDYPGNRKEEICSRLFAFFFNSHNPHGMGTLFYDTLLEVYKEKYKEQIDFDLSKLLYQSNVVARTEIYTSNKDENKLKRIDLLLESDGSIVCIENKIWAELKNNLDAYYAYTESIKGKYRKSLYLILSMREDVEDELNQSGWEHAKDYKVIYYHEYLKILKKNLGDCVTSCNAKYFSVLTDFIQFLDREGGFCMNFNDAEKKFFEDNSEIIQKMIERRNEYIASQKIYQRRYIQSIEKRLEKEKMDNIPTKFWIQDDGVGLGIKFYEGSQEYEIGIESRYEANGSFSIRITIWIYGGNAGKRRNHYEQKIYDQFGMRLETVGKKYQALIASECFKTEDEVFGKLIDTYKSMCDIIKQVSENKL